MESGLCETNHDENHRGVATVSFVITLVNSMAGSAVLTLPYGFQQAGITLGVLLVLLTSCITCYTAVLVVHSGEKAGVSAFGKLAKARLGRKGFMISEITNFIMFSGTVCANLVLLEGNVIIFLGLHPATAVAAIAVCMFAFSLITDMALLVRLNCFASVSSVYLFLFVLIESSLMLNANGLPKQFPTRTDLSFGVLPGMVIYTVLCHGWVLDACGTLQHKRQANLGVAVAFLVNALILIAAGIIGLLAFGDRPIDQNYLTHFGKHDFLPTTAAIALTVQASIFTLLMLHMSKESLQALAFDRELPYVGKLCLYAFILLVTGVVAILYPRVGDVMSWAGSVCGLVLVFICPVMFRLAEGHASGLTVLANILIIVAGVVACGLQVASALCGGQR